MAEEPSPVKQVIDTLVRHGVTFMIIGGQAEVLMGSPRITYDTDIAFPRSMDNLERLARALRELDAKLRVGNEEEPLPFPIDAHSLALGNNFTFTTKADALDILAYVEPIGEFKDLLPGHEWHEGYGHKLMTIGLEDLIRVKEHIRRAKDQESLAQLRGIREARRRKAHKGET